MSEAPWTPPPIAILARSRQDIGPAANLAARLDLPLHVDTPTDPQLWWLVIDREHWCLRRPDGASLAVDFTAPRLRRRVAERGFQRLPLLKAIGIARFRRRHGRSPALIDATAGCGDDAWLAAAAGAETLLIERSPLVHALLEQALTLAARDPSSAPIAARLTLIRDDSIRWMRAAPPGRADVVYLDPMYPPRQRQALVGKKMQFLQRLLPPEACGRALFDAALQAAESQVVVKRPARSPPLVANPAGMPAARRFDLVPQHTTIVSPGTRYDVYHLNRGSSETAGADRVPLP